MRVVFLYGYIYNYIIYCHSFIDFIFENRFFLIFFLLQKDTEIYIGLLSEPKRSGSLFQV